MHLGAVLTGLADRPLGEVVHRIDELGLRSVEIGAGGIFSKQHCNPAELLASPPALEKFQETLAESGLTISAFAMHGEPLHPDPNIAENYDREFRNTCVLAEKIGVSRITLIAGLPEAVPGDKAPNWILYPFPSRNMDMYHWQWEERLIPYWKEHGQIAKDHGIRLCFEMLAGDMVYNPKTLLRLRDEVGAVVGCNLDPSHLFWQGVDITEVVRALGDAIYHVHVKDSCLDAQHVRVNGVLDNELFREQKGRSWVFRTVGFGHDEFLWRAFVSALRQAGYDDVLSIEQEDPLIDADKGLELAIGILQTVLI